MKNTFLLVLLILFNQLFCIGQSSTLSVKVILTNNDTLIEKIRVQTNLFHHDLLNELSVNKRIIVVDTFNKRGIIKATDIKKMTFTDFKQKERTFIGVFWGSYDNTLKELLYDGKIKWYKEYNRNNYDGSAVVINIFVDEKNEMVRIGLFTNIKKKLKELTKSKSALIELIDNTKLTDENILMILKKYDE